MEQSQQLLLQEQLKTMTPVEQLRLRTARMDPDIRSEEIQGFSVTRHELLQLAKYWAEYALYISYYQQRWDRWSSSDRAITMHAWERVNGVANLLGDAVDTAVQQAFDELVLNNLPVQAPDPNPPVRLYGNVIPPGDATEYSIEVNPSDESDTEARVPDWAPVRDAKAALNFVAEQHKLRFDV